MSKKGRTRILRIFLLTAGVMCLIVGLVSLSPIASTRPGDETFWFTNQSWRVDYHQDKVSCDSYSLPFADNVQLGPLLRVRYFKSDKRITFSPWRRGPGGVATRIGCTNSQ